MKYKQSIWKSLFVLYAFYALSEVTLFGYFMVTIYEGAEKPGLVSYLYEGFMLVFLVGFLGLVLSKRILNQLFWQTVLFVALLYFVSVMVKGVNENGLVYFSMANAPWWSIVLTFSVLSAFVANFIYAFKSEDIWNTN